MTRFVYGDDDEKLAQDYDTPFSEPHDKRGQLSDQHPSTDTDLDEHELYDAGLSESAGVYERGEEEII